MKKSVKILLAISLVMMLTAGSALADSPVRFGIRSGFNSASFVGSAVDDFNWTFDRRVDFAMGGLLRWSFADRLALQSELLLTRKGVEWTRTEVLLGDLNYLMRLDYIEIPVLVRYAFADSGKFIPSIMVGPTVGFNVLAKVEADKGELVDGLDVDNAASVDFGLAVEGAVDIQMTKYTLVLGLRYGMGLTNPFEDATTPWPFSYAQEDGKVYDFKHQVISFAFGIVF